VVRRYHLSSVLISALLLSSGSVRAQQGAGSSATTQTKSTKKPAAKTAAKPSSKTAAPAHKRPSPRISRLHQAFVASASLKPMARQLIQDRTPAAYAGVRAYAVRHDREDAGALAWLVIGYARILDRNYAQAIDPLNQAKPRAGEIGDYVNYYLGTAYVQTNHLKEALATLRGFDQSYPDSLLLRDAHVAYGNALVADGRQHDAIELLENDRQPIRADLEFALGRAYEADQQPAKALAIFRNLYYTMPLAEESQQIEGQLTRLASLTGAPPVSLEMRRTRADLLAKGKQYAEASREYSELVKEVGPDDRPLVERQLVEALRHSGQLKEAKSILDSIPSSTPELEAERLFNFAELARSANDDEAFLHRVDQLRSQYPTSPYLEQALLSAGNIYLLRRDYDRAIDSYRELDQRFPNGDRASYAHWKVAWLSLRLGRNEDAKKGFEEQIALYPSSAEVPAALYWRGRLAEEDDDSAQARAFYQKLSERYRNYYYGVQARQRLREVKADQDPPHYALLDRVPPMRSSDSLSAERLPEDNLRVQKAEFLANGGLLELASRELSAAAQETKGNWAPGETARLYAEAGRYDIAIETLKRAFPNYFAVDLPSLPRSYWETLFPKPYWAELKTYSSSNGLDPYLVASLVRQESAFNPNAVSHKNAIGLMQLLPKVGRGVAKQEKLKHFSTTQLFVPGTNLRLGTRYLRSMADKFGSFEYALAAYNAGSDRVADWLGAGQYRDPQEFVESIPFTETREYVQNILRNANLYRQLYGLP
jgi:soluble lytic murein transglycosylase